MTLFAGLGGATIRHLGGKGFRQAIAAGEFRCCGPNVMMGGPAPAGPPIISPGVGALSPQSFASRWAWSWLSVGVLLDPLHDGLVDGAGCQPDRQDQADDSRRPTIG
ncbi:hypothetical protein GCM10010411_76750 [Actinomadura fulvescens]|uniref:Uncharacterized protein n=1 Tax=Actinomadura fulvescens TaxID=46160 RepID=A0ABN3QJJ4_9ACTN